MLCNNKKIGNCVTLLRLTPRKLGGKHRPYVPNDTETDLTLTNTFGSLKSILNTSSSTVNLCFAFIIFIVYITKGFNLGEKNYNISIHDKMMNSSENEAVVCQQFMVELQYFTYPKTTRLVKLPR